MTIRKIMLTPTTKEYKINHALAATSAFNLKLCCMLIWVDLSFILKGLSLNRGCSFNSLGVKVDLD